MSLAGKSFYMTDIVTIKEVAARDGLQAQSVEISLEQRQELIEALSKAWGCYQLKQYV